MDKLNKWKEEYHSVQPPLELLEQVNTAMERAAWEKKKQKVRRRKWMPWAAVLVLLVGLPNMSADAARIMGELPLIGGIFRIVTISNYQYDNGHSVADAAIPMVVQKEGAVEETDLEAGAAADMSRAVTADTMAEVTADTKAEVTSGTKAEVTADTPAEVTSDAIAEAAVGAAEEFALKREGRAFDGEGGVKQLNRQVQEYITRLIEEFENNIETINEGYQQLDVSYEVITDTDSWFTLQISALQTMASGAEQVRYYHIDKTTGELAGLEDICKDGVDYIKILSDEIKRQMVQQMETDENISYFYQSEEISEMDFRQISEEQNFYFNGEGSLVIVFDEYEVAPGYMGCPEFVIPQWVFDEIRK